MRPMILSHVLCASVRLSHMTPAVGAQPTLSSDAHPARSGYILRRAHPDKQGRNMLGVGQR